MSIPKIIHQIWIQGYDNLPDDMKIKHCIIKQHNPNYQIIFWDNDNILHLLKKYNELYQFYQKIPSFTGNTKIYPSMSDVARLVILYEYGGFYIDTDYYCPLSLDKIYNDDDEIVMVNTMYYIIKYIPIKIHSYLLGGKYGTLFMGMIKKHPMFKKLFPELILQTNRNKIGIFLDNFLQRNNYRVTIIDPKYVPSYTTCHTGICHTKKKSTSYFGRDILIFVNCHIKLILLLILLLIIFIYIKINANK